MSSPDGVSSSVRERIYDAVLEELTTAGIDHFRIDRVARRVGLDADMIKTHWHDRRVLLMEALVARAEQTNPCPDTGSLRGDVRELGNALMQATESPNGRQLLHRVLPHGPDTDISEVGQDLLTVRFLSLKRMLDRAAQRGELRPDVDPDEAIRMICAAYLHETIFRDAPIRPECAAQVRDIVLHGVLARPISDSALTEEFGIRERMRALLRAAFDSTIDPVALVEAMRDDDGRIIDFAFLEVNPAACVALQRSRQDLVGASMTEAWPGVESTGLLSRYIWCVETGEPVAVDDLTYFSQRYEQLRRYDVRVGRASADWLSLTWRDVTDRGAHTPRSNALVE